MAAAQPPRAACRHRLAQRPARQPQSAVLKSPPYETHIMSYYSFNPPRRDGRLSWPCCWLIANALPTKWSNGHPSV